MTISLEQFVQHLTQSGLMSAAEVSKFQDSLPPERRPRDAQRHLPGYNHGLTPYRKEISMRKLTVVLMLLLGAIAQAEEKHATKIWDRKDPLGEVPKRITDAYPLSDQENKGGWVKFEPMSDEFEGKELDRNKWTVGLEWWKGRQPALFSEKNVTVSDGKLHLTMRKEKLPAELEKQGYHDYPLAPAAVSDFRQRNHARVVRDAEGRGLAFDVQR